MTDVVVSGLPAPAGPALNGRTAGLVAVGAEVRLQRPDGSDFKVIGKTALMLALLALEGQAERRRLATLMWPEAPAAQARNNLRTLVHRLNQRFGSELVAGATTLRIDGALARVDLHDVATLLAALQAGGPHACLLLIDAGVDGGESEAMDEWLQAARQRLRRAQLSDLSHALTEALALGSSERAVALARAFVQLDPLSEHGYRQLMDTLARCGDRAAALAAYEDCKWQLRQHLGVLPDLQTRTVQLRLLQDQAQEDQQEQPAVDAPIVRTSTVAAGLTPLGGAARYALVERETVLTEVRDALSRGHHVVLRGEAGVGKTRLLRELADTGEVEQVVIRPGAQDEPYAALAQLLQEVQPRRGARVGVPEQIELARLAPLAFLEVQPSQAGLSAPRLHAALRHWVQRLAAAGVQRLVLDDVHYADAESQAAFGAMLARPADDRAAPPAAQVLLAHRSGEIAPALEEALVAAQVRNQLRIVSLPRLTLPGVQALLSAMQVDQPQVLAARMMHRTGGNPLFVIEMAEHAQAGRDLDAAGAENLDALLRSRLAGCSLAAQQLAAVAAVAAQDFSIELAASALERPALGLMPAWSELQQRGLFADHGIAHDLVRDAALGALPPPIRGRMHRQVAEHLEAQGLKGGRVLAHWLAAEDFDRALPHAVNQLVAAADIGLETDGLFVGLLSLMARLSDAVLLSHCWLTMEVQFHDALTAHWSTLQTLVHRVERMAGAEQAAEWLAFERARLTQYRDGQAAKAYAELAAVAKRMADHGSVKATTEILLGWLAFEVSGNGTKEHALRAQAALAGLEAVPSHARLQREVAELLSLCSEPTELLRDKLRALRAARRRRDAGAVDVLRYEIARQSQAAGLFRSAWRFHSVDGVESSSGLEMTQSPEPFAPVALATGRYADALRYLDLLDRLVVSENNALSRIFVWLFLGQWARAKAQADTINVRQLEHCPPYLTALAVARRRIDEWHGVDPVPAIRRSVARMAELGNEGLRQRLIEWELALLTQDARQRAEFGSALVDDALQARLGPGRTSKLLLEVAEAHAQAGSERSLELVRAAARDLRRGRCNSLLYVPEGLVRCARLLEPADPGEAIALMHVARRMVRDALPHVPDFARESFVTDVPVNRLLLDDSAKASDFNPPWAAA